MGTIGATVTGACGLLVLSAMLALASATAVAQQSPPRTTLEEFETWMRTLSNWGRWGPNDEIGAINLITPAKRREAGALVKSGLSVSLAHPLLSQQAVDAPRPFTLIPRVQPEHAFDREEIDFHGYAFSHIDALCHVSHNGKLYNGFDYKEVVTVADGCKKLGISNIQGQVVTRGVLIDIPRLKGVSYLGPGTHVYRADIEAWEKQAKVRVSAGDTIILRTGRWARRAATGAFMDAAGYDASVIPFLKERDVAIIASDAVQDVGDFPGAQLPIHRFGLVALGANLMDNLDLEALATTAAQLNRWEFMLVIAPTPKPNGTGSPINPIAIF
jgi:kynurenine formamidase